VIDSLAIGVDGYPAGWVCVALEDGRVAEITVAPSLEAVAERWPDAGAIGVDIPIGLPESGERRRADVAAHLFVGPRRSSVFWTPSRAALTATYEEARLLGVSRQAYALRGKILEAEQVALRNRRIVEVHPEVSFRGLAGAPLASPKYAWNGFMERLRLLDAAGIALPREIDPPAPAVDVLDAAVAAWSALRVARGQAFTLPSDREPGEPAIFY
jgi:predicted RNase H-like nuclease